MRFHHVPAVAPYALDGPRKVGVLGLGVGALMSYARDAKGWVFYEIDPLIVELATRHFSFLHATKAKVEHVGVKRH